MKGIYTFILLFLGGMACANAQTKPITFDPSKESIFIFGADSYDFRLMFFRVKILDDLTYQPSMFSPARFTGMATDGYIIGKSKAGESVGLLLISYYPPDDFMHYLNFDVCSQTPVFTPSPGQVVYYGDIAVRWAGTDTPLKLSYASDVDRARKFIETTHPELLEAFTSG